MISRDHFYRGGSPESQVPVLQAWTKGDLDKALANDAFLDPLNDRVQAGNFVEVFEVGDLQRPENDPIALATVIVRKVHGPHVSFIRVGETVHFLGDIEEIEPGWGVGTWNKKRCLYHNGHRVKVFRYEHEEPEFRDPGLRQYWKKMLGGFNGFAVRKAGDRVVVHRYGIDIETYPKSEMKQAWARCQELARQEEMKNEQRH